MSRRALLSRRALGVGMFSALLTASSACAEELVYDAAGRLVFVRRSDNSRVIYNYDNAGNRTSVVQAAPFTPVTRTYNSGSGAETVPTGALYVRIRVYGPGGAGGRVNGLPVITSVGGGGGGGFAERTVAVAGGETLNYIVGPAAPGRNTVGPGSASASDTWVTATLASGNVSMRGQAAGGGSSMQGGVGTNGYGGTINIRGTDGVFGTMTNNAGGANNGPSGGAGGVGGGGHGGAPGGGGGGRLQSGYSGNGAAGRVEFSYF